MIYRDMKQSIYTQNRGLMSQKELNLERVCRKLLTQEM